MSRVVLITGSREFPGESAAERARERLRRARTSEYTRHHAEWRQYGKGAGGIRNQVLVDRALVYQRAGDVVEVHAFPTASSRGTWDCVRRARQAELTVVVHRGAR